jgi:hypothetical protein
MSSSPSVQLYTVRDAISEDLQGAVARVAQIGFTKVEPYAFVERADEYARAFADSGVAAPSGHAPVIDGEDIATALPSSESALIVPDARAMAFKNQTPAGQGDVEVAAVLTAAPHALRVVEFDDYSKDVFDGITESFAWLAENDR